MINQSPIDINKSMNAGNTDIINNNDMIDSSTYNENNEIKQSAIDILLALPGVNLTNFRIIMNSVTNLNELSYLNENNIIQLIGILNGKKLYKFLHQTN